MPLGAFLSGGLDSSLLVALMARQITGKRVKTFSVGFEAEGRDLDETDDAERTARFIGTDHTRVVVRGEDVRDRIRHIASGLDQPSVDGVNSYFVSLAARQAVTVAISGTGGDELFAGYPWFSQMVLDDRLWRGQSWRVFARAALAPAVRMSLFDELPPGRAHTRRATSLHNRLSHSLCLAPITYLKGGAARVLAAICERKPRLDALLSLTSVLLTNSRMGRPLSE